VRRFWRGDGGQLAEFASRLAGSSDLFASRGTPLEGVNYVTCHDGRTLHDLVSYERKHNEANGEENRDGPSDHFGRNYGVEGSTTDAEIVAVRERMKRNMLATLAFSQGVPMLTAGDEMGHTQLGNDNAYCQDNETSWVDWNLDATKSMMLEFTRRALAIRRDYAALRKDAFFEGNSHGGLQDVVWFDETGREHSETQWHDGGRRCVAMLIRGLKHEEYKGGLAVLLLINAHEEPRTFKLPAGLDWRELLSTDKVSCNASYEHEVGLTSRSMMLLESHSAD
jgi:glycogen operon protein